ncbi:DUF4142 domain-containing protein [Sphingobium sp.]|uniref:DUF4142 domain-containing protein n=1 Tax=Sphingobium sp. TaxID=1912891 RepID=UPI0028BE5E63|nr:DUF4142 domain-containing protein [Sphingobium sp.]
MHRTTVAVLMAGLTLAACNQATEQRAANAANSVGAAADAMGNRIENVTENAVAEMTPTPTPQDFVNMAGKSDAFEIAAARLAATNAQSAEVKAFAQKMIEAHTASTAKIKAAAGKAQPTVKPDPSLTADQKEDLADLKKLTGAKFDAEYVEGQVEAHEDALKLMRSFAKDGADGSLKAVAGDIAPVVEGHLKMARDLHDRTDE